MFVGFCIAVDDVLHRKSISRAWKQRQQMRTNVNWKRVLIKNLHQSGGRFEECVMSSYAVIISSKSNGFSWSYESSVKCRSNHDDSAHVIQQTNLPTFKLRFPLNTSIAFLCNLMNCFSPLRTRSTPRKYPEFRASVNIYNSSFHWQPCPLDPNVISNLFQALLCTSLFVLVPAKHESSPWFCQIQSGPRTTRIPGAIIAVSSYSSFASAARRHVSRHLHFVYILICVCSIFGVFCLRPRKILQFLSSKTIHLIGDDPHTEIESRRATTTLA